MNENVCKQQNENAYAPTRSRAQRLLASGEFNPEEFFEIK